MTIELIDYIQDHPNTIYHMDKFLIKYQNPIFNFVRLSIGNHHDSLELTNRILLTLARKVKEIREKKSFNRLVLKIIKGELANHWKGKKRLKRQLMKNNTIYHDGEEISLLETLESEDSKAEEILNLLMIRELVENSSDPYTHEIFVLRYRDDKSIESISHQLGLSEYRIKKYLTEIQNKAKLYLENG